MKERLKQIGCTIYHLVLFPVRDNPVFFLFTLLVNTQLLIVGNLYAEHTNAFLGTLLPLFDGYVFCMLASLTKKIHLRGLVWTIYGVTTLGETFSIFCYHSQYCIRVLQLVMQTTGQETSEFIANTLLTPAPWLAVGIMLLCIGLAFFFHHLLQTHLPKMGKQIGWVLVFAAVVWSATREIPQYIRTGRSFSEDTTTLLGDHRHLPTLSSCFVRLGYSTAFNLVSTREMQYLADTVEQTEIEGCTHECPTIILIIGESFSRHQTPLYDSLCLPVSPHLQTLHQQGNLWIHSDAVACSNLTSTVMKHIFSTWNEDCTDGTMSHTLFPAVFRKAGYKVWFLSNQFCIGTQDIWSMIGGTIFNHPKLSELQFDIRNTNTYPYDEELLQDLPSADSLTLQPSLLIFHVMGQHVDYKERYPSSFDRFQSEDVHIRFGGQHAKEIAAQYANATLYNDSVISALWSRFADKDVIAIYLSDHGEEVYDYRNFYERSDLGQLTPEVAKYQLEIPMFFLMSDCFQVNHPELLQQIQDCLNKPFISNDLCQILFHLAGIQHKDYCPERDLLSPQYDIHRPRWVGNGVNYNELIQETL